MFGFLKDKLKAAVQKFTKSAQEEVKEEKVEGKQAIEQAEKIVPKKTTAPATKAPAAPKPAPKKPKKEARPVEKPPQKMPERAKAAPEPSPAPVKTPRVEEETAEQKPAVKEVASPRVQAADKKPAPGKTTPGFFKRLFGKKEAVEEAIAETIEEVKEEVIDTVEEREIKQELAAAEAIERQTQAELAQEAIEEEIAKVDEAAEALHEEEEEFEERLEAGEAELPAAEKPSFFGRLTEAFTKKTLSEEKFDEIFWELELAMLENNVAVEVIEKIKQDLKAELTSGKVSRMGVEDMISARLRQSVEELFDVETFDLVERIRSGPRPFKICIVGVNGSGKTTTLAKIVHLLQRSSLSAVVAASDTFRAAAIDQLKEHTDRLGVKLISQGYGADPAAVAFDAIKHAESKGIDVVLIDTAGRLHSNTNLMAELQKVVRVAKPDLKIFVGESITGNDCVEQAKVYNDIVGIDAIILSKADIDEKGGAAISVSYVTGKPILYLGTGQTYDDLQPFEKEKIIEAVGL